MAGLQVGQACGVPLLHGFGVSSPSSQVPGHPTFICDAGVNVAEYRSSYHVASIHVKLKNATNYNLYPLCS